MVLYIRKTRKPDDCTTAKVKVKELQIFKPVVAQKQQLWNRGFFWLYLVGACLGASGSTVYGPDFQIGRMNRNGPRRRSETKFAPWKRFQCER